MGEVLKVFISATSADLGAVRVAARAALEANPYFKPLEQAHFGPAAESLGAGDLRRLAECDAVLHIVGECYGHEPPPSARPRRSYTQLEHDDARALRKPLYLFVCADGFPYTPHDPEPDDKRDLQKAHRTVILAGHDKYDLIADLPAFQQKIREIDLPLQELLKRKARHRRFILAAVALLCLALVLSGAYVLRATSRAPQASADSAREGAKEGVLAAESFDPVRIKANLQKQIKERAAAELAPLDPFQDWEKIAAREKRRDQQLGDVDRLVEQMQQVFEKKEASANYAVATRLLAENGVAETLRFLELKSGARETKIAALKGSLELTERVRSAQESELREALREKLLAASLLEQDAQWDKAEAEYRAVVRDGGAWAEPRNRLAQLLWRRGAVIKPEEGNRKLREAVELCQGTLAAHPRAADPEAWAEAQFNLATAAQLMGSRADGAEAQQWLAQAVTAHRAALGAYTREQLPQAWAATQVALGIVLSEQGTRAEGAESLRLLGEAVTADRAALEVYTRAQWPQDWAMTQNNLGTALEDQGRRAERAESLRLLGEAVTAYRAALEVRTRAQLPQDWAMTQNNLAIALRNQGARAAGAESLRLLGEAVTAYHAALEVYTRAQLPQLWAMTQNNLAIALWNQGTRAEGAEILRLLGEAVTAYRAALEVYTRAELPQDWAKAQYNLALALAEQGARAEGSERQRLLGEAVAADRAALEVHTRAHLPQDWRNTTTWLAINLRSLAEHAPPAEAAKLRADAEGIDRELNSAP